MITVGNDQELNPNKYDENWLIVRKPDDIPDFVRHVPVLSPSPELFRNYREAYHAGLFDQRFFEERYVPQFLRELSENTEAIETLQFLTSVGREKNVMLACYCETESICHRSIIAGILLGMGAEIHTREEYFKYYKQFQKLQNDL